MGKTIVEIESMLEELIPNYLDNRSKEVDEMKSLYGKGDLNNLAKLAHKIAGNSGSYGFHEMGTFAKEIENLCTAGNQEGVSDLITNIESYLANIEIKYV
jgi:hypothetical protein